MYACAGLPSCHMESLASAAAEANFSQAAAAVAALGGMPAMVSAHALAHSTSDALTLAAFTAYVGARLLESASEERAAFCIQTYWRRRSSWSPGQCPVLHGRSARQYPAKLTGVILLPEDDSWPADCMVTPETCLQCSYRHQGR